MASGITVLMRNIRRPGPVKIGHRYGEFGQGNRAERRRRAHRTGGVMAAGTMLPYLKPKAVS